VASPHLAGLGAREVSRSQFVALLHQYARREPKGKWT
jgi:Leu/Phe-tRNA-protein transferase